MAHSRADELFLETLHDTITKNIEDTDLDVEKLAEIMNMSRITLYRKIKAISVLTPIELINITRLKKPLNYWHKEITAFSRFHIWLVLVHKVILPEISRSNSMLRLPNT